LIQTQTYSDNDDDIIRNNNDDDDKNSNSSNNSINTNNNNNDVKLFQQQQRRRRMSPSCMSMRKKMFGSAAATAQSDFSVAADSNSNSNSNSSSSSSSSSVHNNKLLLPSRQPTGATPPFVSLRCLMFGDGSTSSVSPVQAALHVQADNNFMEEEIDIKPLINMEEGKLLNSEQQSGSSQFLRSVRFLDGTPELINGDFYNSSRRSSFFEDVVLDIYDESTSSNQLPEGMLAKTFSNSIERALYYCEDDDDDDVYTEEEEEENDNDFRNKIGSTMLYGLTTIGIQKTFQAIKKLISKDDSAPDLSNGPGLSNAVDTGDIIQASEIMGNLTSSLNPGGGSASNSSSSASASSASTAATGQATAAAAQ